MCVCVWISLHFDSRYQELKTSVGRVRKAWMWGCFASHRNRFSQAGRKLSDLYMDLIWQSQWGRRIPPWGWGAQTILEEAALTSNLRLPLFLIIHSLDFRNRIAHVVFVARKVSLLRNRAPFFQSWLRETVNEMVLYLWTKCRTIPFFVVLLGIFNLFVMIRLSLSYCVARRVLCFFGYIASMDCFVYRTTPTVCSLIFVDGAQNSTNVA